MGFGLPEINLELGLDISLCMNAPGGFPITSKPLASSNFEFLTLTLKPPMAYIGVIVFDPFFIYTLPEIDRSHVEE